MERLLTPNFNLIAVSVHIFKILKQQIMAIFKITNVPFSFHRYLQKGKEEEKLDV